MTRSTEAEESFTEIFEAYHASVHAYLLGRIGDRELGRDLLQETFLRVWRRFDEVRALPPQRRQAWIFTVARNLVTDSYRARATREATARTLADHMVPTTGAAAADPPAAHVERNELMNDVMTAVRTLPEEARVILAMHAVGELTSAQIGEALGQPAGTIRYKLARARQALAKALGLNTLSLEEVRR
ncbi:sigma-70 family RNA polymerase sigma factor [Actinopolymorpha sp. B17G11]|uniref:RNA polymerase sigma factor n=1 Tax=unclassified Actinopolymorpha TaxID=2627063 RepID=UPI0032D8B9BD